jgi:hypothetical protein
LTCRRWWLEGLRQSVEAFADDSLPAIWRWLQRWQQRYKRGRQAVHTPDMDYVLKLVAVPVAVQEAQQWSDQVVALYMDELTYYRRPSLARAYASRGHQQVSAALGHTRNRKRRIVACLNAVTGTTFSWQRDRFDHGTLLRFHHAVADAYPDRHSFSSSMSVSSRVRLAIKNSPLGDYE